MYSKIVYCIWILLVVLQYIHGQCIHTPEGSPILWSNWVDKPLADGSSVTIDEGEIIKYNVNEQYRLKSIVVRGILWIDQTQALELNVEEILVYGKIILGSEECPSYNDFTLNFYGNKIVETSETPIWGYKGLIIMKDGVVELFGKPTSSWMNLEETALEEQDEIRLRESPLNWATGDELLLTPTDWHAEEAEIFGIAAPLEINEVSKVYRYQMDKDLTWRHYAKTWRGDYGEVIETYRGEVAKLNRNIKIIGHDTESNWGFHIMVKTGAEMRISNVELIKGGQDGVLGRYPIHFHQTGDGSASFVKNCSIHDAFQRAVTIHGTNSVLVEHVVAYNVKMHAYFLEDGDEENNHFHHCLACIVTAGNLLGHDTLPSAFWIPNPANRWTDNSASGTDFGYWFSLPGTPIGLAANKTDMFPLLTPILEFDNNVAHSLKRNGIHFQPDGHSVSTGLIYNPVMLNWAEAVKDRNKPLESLQKFSGRSIGILSRTTAYKCVGLGIWSRGKNEEYRYNMLFDNMQAGEFAGSNDRFVRGVIVAYTDNAGTPSRWIANDPRSVSHTNNRIQGVEGYHFYHDIGPTTLTDVIFYNFTDWDFGGTYIRDGVPQVRVAMPITTDVGHFSIYPHRSRFYGLKFVNCDRNVWLATTHDFDHGRVSTLMLDNEGGITGECGATITSRFNPLMIGEYDVIKDDPCVKDDNVNGWICPASHPRRHIFIVNGLGATAQDKNMTFIRLSDHAYANILSVEALEGQLHLITNRSYLVLFESDIVDVPEDQLKPNLPKFTTVSSQTYSSMQFELQHTPTTEYARFVIPFPVGSTITSISTQVRTFQEAATSDDLDLYSYYWDSTNGWLWIHCQAESDAFEYQGNLAYNINRDYRFQIDIKVSCPGSDCSVTDRALSTLIIPSIPDTNPENDPIWQHCGDRRVGGTFEWNELNKLSIFDGTMNSSWSTGGLNSIIVDEFGSNSGNNVIKATTAIANGDYIFKANNLEDAPEIGEYSHLKLSIRIDPIDYYLGVASPENVQLGIEHPLFSEPWLTTAFIAEISNPYWMSYPPFDIHMYKDVYIPLRVIQGNTVEKPSRFRIKRLWSDGNGAATRTTNYFVKEISFVNVNRVYTEDTSYVLFDDRNPESKSTSQHPLDHTGPGSYICDWTEMKNAPLSKCYRNSIDSKPGSSSGVDTSTTGESGTTEATGESSTTSSASHSFRLFMLIVAVLYYIAL